MFTSCWKSKGDVGVRNLFWPCLALIILSCSVRARALSMRAGSPCHEVVYLLLISPHQATWEIRQPRSYANEPACADNPGVYTCRRFRKAADVTSAGCSDVNRDFDPIKAACTTQLDVHETGCTRVAVNLSRQALISARIWLSLRGAT